MTKTTIAGCLVILAALAAAGAAPAQAETYEVTVTNLTRGQILSPPVVISHRRAFALFTPGAPASDELAGLAEDAVSEPLLALLGTDPLVMEAAIGGGPVLPGESMTVAVEAAPGFRNLTVAAMLVTTNDAFAAARGRAANGEMFFANAWDAGSEKNTQLCAHIPGPPCGNPGVRRTAGAEGFVHVHAGVHRGGNLKPRDHDWRNPVARVTVRRVQ